MDIGKLERVALRDIWKHEALDFTTWLQDNVDSLNEVLDFTLSSPEKEQSAGSFSVDIIAEDENGSPVVVENQLEKSDHDHLGKIITYLSVTEAKRAIWIVGEPRPEHVRAITWLNDSGGAAFYIVKLEGIRIGKSEPAPLFTLIAGPSEESTFAGAKRKELAGRYLLRHRFWEGFLNVVKNKTKLYKNVSATKDSWISGGSGVSGINFVVTIRQHDTQVEIWIGRGKDKADENLKIFESFFKQKSGLESAFGQKLDWQRLDGKQGCRIRRVFDVGGYQDETEWEKLYDLLADGISRLESAFRPRISKLKL